MDIKGITDIHMHLVPGVDDGAINIEMSMNLLAMARDEGIQSIFATPHYGPGSGYTAPFEVIERQYTILKEMANKNFPDIRIFRGNEICYEEVCISNWIEQGKAASMERSKYILFEFSRDSGAKSIEHALLSVLDMGWWPILAHAERHFRFHENLACLQRLVQNGVYLQVNAYSLVEEQEDPIRTSARRLIENEMAHFIGSDAHKDYHRPPRMRSGVNYLYENCRKEYADRLIHDHAECILQGVRL